MIIMRSWLHEHMRVFQYREMVLATADTWVMLNASNKNILSGINIWWTSRFQIKYSTIPDIKYAWVGSGTDGYWYNSLWWMRTWIPMVSTWTWTSLVTPMCGMVRTSFVSWFPKYVYSPTTLWEFFVQYLSSTRRTSCQFRPIFH